MALTMNDLTRNNQVLKGLMKKAEARAAQEILRRQLRHRFRRIPSWADERIKTADDATLDSWSLRVLDAPTLREVFAEPEAATRGSRH